MTKDELRGKVSSYIQKALQLNETLSSQRDKALRYYNAEKLGNEVEGRSQVVSTDVSDKVEWVMPDLMRIFTAGSDVVRFEPTGPEDEEAAKQETDYVNHVFMNQNNGYQIFYTWFKAALLFRNSIVKYYWEENSEVEYSTYTGIDDITLHMLLDEEGVEPVEHTETPIEGAIDEAGNPVISHDIKIKRINKTGRARVIPVPPEEALVDPRMSTQDIQEAEFFCHRSEKTKEDLMSMGIKEEEIDKLPKDGELRYSNDRNRRFSQEDQALIFDNDKHMIYECYIRVDFDGDGVRELIKVITDQQGSVILDIEDVDEIPFASLTPVIMPYKFYGRSIPDQMIDIQLEKSVLKRNILDNLYLINNSRTEVVEGQVNLDDLLTSRPGGVVRVRQPGMVKPLDVQPFSGHAFGMLEYLDSEGENRTGVTKYNQGMDANTLNKTAHGITQIMNAAKQRVELVARTFAETGVKQLFIGLHNLLLKHQRKAEIVRLRGAWTPVDPSRWDVRKDMTVNVGLGTGDQDAKANKLLQILGVQKEIVAAGGMGSLVTPMNLYNTLTRLVEAAGLKSGDGYFNNPSQAQPQPEKPDPDMEKVKVDAMSAKAKIDLERMKAQAQIQLQREKLQNEILLKEAELKAEIALREAELDGEMNLKSADIALSNAVKHSKNLTDVSLNGRVSDG